METFHGLPLHPLVVHAVVVLLPLTALCVVLHALWPAAARRLGGVTPLLGIVCAVLVPFTIQTGHAFARTLGFNGTLPPLVLTHEQLANRLVPWSIGLAVAAIAIWLVRRSTAPRGLLIAVAVLAIVGAVGTTIAVAQTGEAGARAVWSGR